MNSAERKWRKGKPPSIGWWNASNSRKKDTWRWWNGSAWSLSVSNKEKEAKAGRLAKCVDLNSSAIEWNDFWPEDARVARSVFPKAPKLTAGRKEVEAL